MIPSEAAALLKKQNNILIVTHKKPDGDTLGSASALCHALNRAGKTAYLYANPDIVERFIPYCESYIAKADFIPEFVVAVDVAAPDMVAKGANYEYNLVIDHHPTNPQYGKFNCVFSNKSSCGEIVLEIIENINGNVDKQEANLLYIAISTDTGCFQYSNTNADTFQAASKLLGCGADNVELNIKFFRQVSIRRIKLESLIYSGMSFYHDGQVVVVKVTNDMMNLCGATENDCEDIASLSGRVDTSLVGITIRENVDGTSKLSIRSTNRIDCSELCAQFGGGGHKAAAGCTLNCDTTKAEELIIEALDKIWMASF